MQKGAVYLVGAGPGGMGLITVRGLGLLRQVDVVVYDRLADDGLLAQARGDAELIYVGKSAGDHTIEQSEINRILVAKAAEGKSVVRLKGGDPFVLGRGGEEAEALYQGGIPFEVVPGVTSAVAVPAFAGIPVTHRGMASSFAVVTGHEDPTKEDSSVDWKKLATSVDTLVCLMGMGNLKVIVDRLIKGGRSLTTPVALIRNGATPRQRTLVATLATIVAHAERADFKPPVVIVVGDVVALRERLAWFDNRPLFGKRVLVTRSRAQASKLSKLLSELGAEAIELPVIESRELEDMTRLDLAVSKLRKFQWVLFTSVNGVDAFWKRVRAAGRDARWFGKVKIGAIGPATADRLRDLGLYPDFVSEEFTSDSMLRGLADMDIAGCRVLLPRSDIAPKDLIDGLKRLGARPIEVAAYRTAKPDRADSKGIRSLIEGEIDIVTFTSSSTVTNLLAALDGDIEAINRALVACIGPSTASAAEKAGICVDIIAQEHTIPGLVAAIEEYFTSDKEGGS
ncbi:MAG: uroporphyrinogen-III C-methyltransferase [Dehalococcoidia bacterium]|jgi:uroporphyrinogen III methyltransferase/synthase